MKSFFFISLIFLAFFSACDFFQKEIPPDQLPPAPDQCKQEENAYANAVFTARTTAKASQVQVTKLANDYLQCIIDAGLSKAEAAGIVKQKEKTVSEEAKKSGTNAPYVF